MDRTLCVLSRSSSSSWTYSRGRSNYNTSTGSEAQYFPPHRQRNSLFFCSTKICDSSTSTLQLRTAAASSEVPNSFLSSKGSFRVRLQRRRRIRRKKPFFAADPSLSAFAAPPAAADPPTNLSLQLSSLSRLNRENPPPCVVPYPLI